MKEYSLAFVTVNYPDDSTKDLCAVGWFPSADSLAVEVRRLIESEYKASSFVFSIVQRDHTP